MISLTLPSLGGDMTEGRLLAWRLAPGDEAEANRVLALLESAGQTFELKVGQAGTVLELLARPGDTLPVGALLATLLEPDSPPAARGEDEEAGGPRERLAALRLASAQAMARSGREIPHFQLSQTIPMARALEWLARENASRPAQERLLPAVLQIKAVARALARHPTLNGYWEEGRFRPADGIHPGIAISLPDGGQVAPALLDADRKTLPELMKDLGDLVRHARMGELWPAELSQASITVSIQGEREVELVFGVIYPPQVALVAFGGIGLRPWVENGELCAQPLVSVSLCGDHRVSDAHRGALFLAEVRDWLQRPEELARD